MAMAFTTLQPGTPVYMKGHPNLGRLFVLDYHECPIHSHGWYNCQWEDDLHVVPVHRMFLILA